MMTSLTFTKRDSFSDSPILTDILYSFQIIIRCHYFLHVKGALALQSSPPREVSSATFRFETLGAQSSVRFEPITLAKDIGHLSKFSGITIISYACSNHQQAYYKLIRRRFPPSDTITIYGNQIDVKLYGHR